MRDTASDEIFSERTRNSSQNVVIVNIRFIAKFAEMTAYRITLTVKPDNKNYA